MKPPGSFAGMKVPDGWLVIGSFLEKRAADGFSVRSICCNDGEYWDYYDYDDDAMLDYVKFDASGCETLEEVCALVEVLVRMS